MQKLFLSTAIDYVNSIPHAGHALEKIQADVIARYRRLLDEEVFFLTGTDENSLKNVQAAREEGISVKKLVDRNAKKFYQLKKALNLTFDDFIRTTEERHIKGAQKLWLACQKDIYKKTYRGLYCIGCEEFYKESELKDGFCPEHKTKPDLIEEENYFFQLSKYQNQLKNILEKDEIKIIPETRKNEIISFINSGLEDICISREAKRGRGWGIPVPGDPSQILWTWFDALSNYINALGYGEDSEKFQEWWQENVNRLHIIGKGILRFHAIYWPAILLSAGISLPKTILVHGYVTSNGQKMSKSLGNVIWPEDLVEKFGIDGTRYLLMSSLSYGQDGDISWEKLREKYNADLASGLGNLVARVLTIAERIKIQTYSHIAVKEEIGQAWKNYKKDMEEFKFNEALKAIWDLISFCDKYIEKERPWEENKKQKEVISNLLFAINEIAKLLEPFLPETSEKILKQLKTKKSKILFPKLRP